MIASGGVAGPARAWRPTLDLMHERPALVWEGAESPSLFVTSASATPLRLELKALLGGTTFSWVQEAWIDAETTEGVPLALPPALADHPLAVGVPLVVYGTLHTAWQSVAIPARHGVLDARPQGRVFRATAQPAEVHWVEGLYPARAANRPRVGRDADDATQDTGLPGGAP